jgi:hypothetical protein
MQQKIEYFCSQISRKLLENLTQDYIWIRSLKSEPEGTLTEQLMTSAKAFRAAANIAPPVSSSRSDRGDGPSSKSTRAEELLKASEQLSNIAAEKLAESALLETKQRIFY